MHWGWVIFCFFSLTYFKATHKKNLFDCPSIQTPTTYLCPTKNPKPHHHSRTKVVLKLCYKRQCCKGSVEAMLQKQCWSDVAKDVAEVVLQKTFPQKITSAFVASKCTSTLFFSLSFFHFCSLAKKMIMNVALIFIFCCPYEITAKNDNECSVCCHLLLFLWNQGKRQQRTCLVLFFFFFFLHYRNNDEPPHSSPCSAIQGKKKNIKT